MKVIAAITSQSGLPKSMVLANDSAGQEDGVGVIEWQLWCAEEDGIVASI